MKSIRALSFMPVVCAETGKKIGRVKAVHADKGLHCITGLWISGRLGKAAFYPKSSVLMLGKTAVMISGEKAKGETGEKFSLRRAMNAAGEWIGVVTNAYADPETLEITRLEVSRDVFSDLARGRRTCRLFTVNEETGDVTIEEEREDSV